MLGKDPKFLSTLASSATPGRQCEVAMMTDVVKWQRKLKIEELEGLSLLRTEIIARGKKAVLSKPSAVPAGCFMIVRAGGGVCPGIPLLLHLKNCLLDLFVCYNQ